MKVSPNPGLLGKKTLSSEPLVRFPSNFQRFSRLFKCKNICQLSSRFNHFCIGVIFKIHLDDGTTQQWHQCLHASQHTLGTLNTHSEHQMISTRNNGVCSLVFDLLILFSALFSLKMSVISGKN